MVRFRRSFQDHGDVPTAVEGSMIANGIVKNQCNPKAEIFLF
jgi:hypothetical protein